MALICLKIINAARVFIESMLLVRPGRELAMERKEHVEIYISSQSSILVIAFLLLIFFSNPHTSNCIRECLSDFNCLPLSRLRHL